MTPINNKNKLKCALATILITILTFGTVQARFGTHRGVHNSAPLTSDAVVLDWIEIARTTIFPNGPPFEAARRMAIVQVAVFEAVNATTGKYEPYLGTVTAPDGASSEAAAVMASWGVLDAFYGPNNAALNNARDLSLASIADGQAKIDGMAVGVAAAAAMMANRADDHSTPAMFHTPPSLDPYEWQPYTGCPSVNGSLVGAFRHWPNVTPFGIVSSSQFRAEPPPELGSGVYAQDFNEVQRVGALNASADDRPQDRTNVAKLYAVTPGHWLWSWALVQIARTRNDEITDTARVAALMNMAINDAYITGFESKYFYRTWRPITAIPRGDEDGNKRTTESSFTPLIGTPCFPSYPSNHGIGSGAARTVLAREYGRFKHEITFSHSLAPNIEVNYSDLKVITDDIADARVYGGIHWRYDQDSAEKQGHEIGQFVYNNNLRKAEK
jgi:hypothetical protein